VRCIQITRFGGPEVLEVAEVDDPVPAPGLEVYTVTASGLNFADTHQSEDSYLAPQTLPLIPGAEFAGLAADGTRVVGLLPGGGGYAEKVRTPPGFVWPIPDGVSDAAALAVVLQGVTAWHALRTCAHLAPGESVVVHAAGGGVGTIAVQLARAWGAGRIIATASSDAKRDLALSLGADVAIGTDGDLVAALKEANGGRRVDVVLEMVGGPVFDASLRSLAPFGRLVTYGQASRQTPAPVDPTNLMAHSSAVIGFWLAHCFGRPELLRPPVSELLDMLASGALRAVEGGTFALADAAAAHHSLRDRSSVGKLVLDPRA
jgi:NADPH:quinone reductase